MARTRPRWTFPVVAFLGSWLLRLWRLTWRVDEQPKRHVLARKRARAPGDPGTVYLVWHSRLLVAAAMHTHVGMSAMISLHGDGEYIARTVGRLGIQAVRGSTTRGGARALLGAVEILRGGGDCTFTPDGPKGPRLRVQQGCVAAASMSGAPIVPANGNLHYDTAVRILYLTDRLSVRGGADQHLLQVLSWAAGAGHRVVVAAGRIEIDVDPALQRMRARAEVDEDHRGEAGAAVIL